MFFDHGGDFNRSGLSFVWRHGLARANRLHRVRYVGNLDHARSLLHLRLRHMIQALRKRVIGEPVENKTSGTIAIPDQFKEANSIIIHSVGPDLSCELKPGDRVALHPNAAWTNIEHEGRPMRVVNEEYLLALMED